MAELKSFFFSDKDLYQKSLKIRHEVFIAEQKVDPSLEIENEEPCHFYLVLIDETPAGTGRWRETEKGIKLERFAVLSEYRNHGIGTVLLKRILGDILPLNKKIYLHSQINALNYYERQGFVKSGNVFTEANIQHYLMIFQK